MTLKEIEVFLQNAVGGIDRIYEHWTGCDGEVVNLSDYTVVIDRTGGYHVMHEDFTERLAHTWHRNSRSIGIAMACCKDAICYYDHPDGIDLGSEPPTAAQIEAMAMLTAKAEEILGLTADDVYTHAEIAEIDGYLLSGGYTVPLAGTPATIKKYCVDIACASLIISTGMLENDPGGKAVVEQADIARRYLDKVAQGKYKIPGYDENSSKPPSGNIQAVSMTRMDWKGY